MQTANDQPKTLFTWNWIGGGYNQHYAHTAQEAMEHANTMCSLKPNMSTFSACTEDEAESYWRNFPIFD